MIYILTTLDREVMIPSFKQISPQKALYEILKVSITLTNELPVKNIFLHFALR